MQRVLNHLRQLALTYEGLDLTDGQLVERFLAHRDETAFATLVRRHGPMVRSVCRRVVGNEHDADDAFQATFLVLVRKAASVRPREQVGNWLYGVAHRTALKARSLMLRRRAKEKQFHDLPDPSTAQGPREPDWQPLLDRELSQLPAKYRVPLILCELQGRSRRDAARQLRLPEGTLSSRLATGRKMLARRLARYLPAASVTGLTALLARDAKAGLPQGLLVSTVQAATLVAAGQTAATGALSASVITLLEGVLKAMFLAKLKVISAVLLALALFGAGMGRIGREAAAGLADKGGRSKPGLSSGPARRTQDVETTLLAVSNMDYKEVPLRQVLDDVRAWSSINIVVDQPNLDQEGLSLDRPVTFRVDAVSLRTALKLLLRSVSMAYAIEDGVVVVGSEAAARRFRLKVYPVADLTPKRDNGNAEALVRIIAKTVEPATWADLGGRGTIDYYAEGRSLVVSQTSDIHDQIQTLLDGLRTVMKDQRKE
jgi:RNA polymerase sigma factor (sigma-70 family)